MFERYTERARRVLFFARYEASQSGSVSIEVEHLLLGLLREARRVLQSAAEEADRLLHNYIGVEHLLLAILREETSPAAKMLTKRGMTLAAARALVVELLQVEPTLEASSERFALSLAPTDPMAEERVSASSSENHWAARGFTLEGLVAHAFDVDPIDVICPVAETRRFDRSVTVPRPAAPEVLKGLARDAIQRFFGVSLERRDRRVFITRSDSKP